MNLKRKVLLFTSPECGGAERITITISKFFDPSKYDKKFVIVGKTIGNIVTFIPDNIPYIHLKTYTKWDMVTMRMYHLIKSEKADVVFCSLMYLNIRMILAAKLYGKCRSIVRCDNYFKTLRIDDRILLKFFYFLADKIIAQQDDMKLDLLKHCKFIEKNKVITLLNPINKETIDKMSKESNPYPTDNSIKFVSVGRVVRQKGFDLLITAFAEFHKNNPQSNLYIVGKFNNDDYYKQLRTQILNYGLINNVEFVGFKENPYVWIKYADCFVLSSRFEGLPNALLDALYMQKPVASFTCIPVIKDIIKEGINGYTADPENCMQLAIAMEKALQIKNPERHYTSASKEDFINLFEE